jgi:hypothetical protein
MFNIIQIAGTLQDVLYKTKLSGAITADPGTGTQTLLAYSRDTGELLGSTVWDPITKTFELFLPTTTDERIFLTRIDNNGQYFAETYDRLSLCTVNNVHGESYVDVQNTSFLTTKLQGIKPGVFRYPFTIIHENLKRVNGTFSFPNNHKEGTFLVNGNYYPLGTNANGLLYSNEGLIICDADKSQNYTVQELLHSFDSDPFNDGSMIAGYPLILDGKDSKRIRNVDIEKTWRLFRAGYWGSTDLPKIDTFQIPLVINRATTTTIYFEMVLGTTYNTYNTYLMIIPDLIRVVLYSNGLYWAYLNPGVVSETSYALTYPSKVTVAIVIVPSGSDKLYINGALAATKAIVTPVKTNQEYFSFPLQRGDNYSSTHDVTLTGVAIFNRELTLAEVQALATINNQKTLTSVNYVNAVVTGTDRIKTGRNKQEVVKYFGYLENGSLGNKLGFSSWYSTHYGITEKQNHIELNGTTGLLYRTNTKNTNNLDVRVRFSANAVTAQCIWKIGNTTDGIAIGINGSSQLTLYARNSNVLTSISVAVTLSNSTWYVALLSGGFLKLFSDIGAELGSIANSLTIGTYSGFESLGGAYDGSPITGTAGNSGYFSGAISNLLLADKDTIGDYVVGSENILSAWVGEEELPVEVVKWDMDNDSIVLWTKVPELSSDGTSIAIKQSLVSERVGNTESRNAQEVWNSDFVAVYHMGQNSKLIDSTSNRFHGTLIGIDSSNFSDHTTGSKLTLNGTDEYAQMTFPIIKDSQRFSVSALFNPTTIANGDALIDVALTDAADNDLQLSMQFDSTSKLNASLTDSSEVSIGSVVSDTLTTGSDKFITLNYTGKSEVDGLTLYVDGIKADSDNSTGKRVANSNAVFNIGKDAYSANYYDGSISELFIRNKPMTEDFETVLRLSTLDQLGTYTIQQGTITVDPVSKAAHHWTMDDITGGVIVDEIGSISLTYETTQIAGKFGLAMRSAAPDLNIIASENVGFRSISLWFRRQNTANVSNIIGTLNTTQTFAIDPSYSHYLYFYNGIDPYSRSTVVCNDTNWHHLVIVEGTTINKCFIYYDGSKYITELNSYFNGVFRQLGRHNSAAGQENCDIDNVQVYDFILSDLEVQELFNTVEETTLTTLIPYPIDQYDKFLLHSNTIDGSTSFIDSIGIHTITANGPIHKTDNFKFGTSSMYFDGVNDYLQLSSTTEFCVGTNDFTFDFWIYAITESGPGYIFDLSNNEMVIQTNGSSGIRYYNTTTGTGSPLYTTVPALSMNTWNHIAVCRRSGITTIYKDGSPVASGTDTHNYAVASKTPVIGKLGSGSSYFLKGYLDEFRFSRYAKYVGRFIPPTMMYGEELLESNGIILDQYWDNVSLYMPMNGISNSTIFQDLKGKTVTVNGDAKLSGIQSKFGGISAYFETDGASLSVSDSSTFLFDGDFTIESWIYPIGAGSLGFVNYFSVNNLHALYLDSATSGRVIIAGSNYITGIVLTANAWQHYALVRQGTSIKVYINGVQSGTTGTLAGNIGANTANYIGGSSLASHTGYGYIDDLRITKGVARYTSTFTPPTKSFEDSTPLWNVINNDPNWYNTVLALPFNTENGLTDLKGKTVSAFGNAAITPSQFKFGDASLSLDGTGDYLTIPDSTDWDFGTGDFTVECYIRFNATGVLMTIAGNYIDSVTGWSFQYRGTTTSFAFANGDTFLATYSTFSPVIGQWYHLAVSRASGTIRLFIDGVQVQSNANSTNITGSNNPLAIGFLNYSGGMQYVNGYIDDLRITKGIARYTDNFTLPSESYFYNGVVAIDEDQYWDNVILAMPMEGANNSTIFSDAKGNKNITRYGDAKISQTQKKFGTSSAYFDGTGDYIIVPSSTDFNLSNSNFTIEAWVYLNGYPQNNSGEYQCSIISKDLSGSREFSVSLVGTASSYTALRFIGFSDNSTYTICDASYAFNLNTWYHVSIVRNGNAILLFVNGALLNTIAFVLTIQSTNTSVSIGSTLYGSPYFYYFNGYIDDLRVTKGVARYTSAFTPPTKSYFSNIIQDTLWNNVVLLCNFNGVNNSTSFIDQKGKTVSVDYGTPVISTSLSKFGESSLYLNGSSSIVLPNSSDFVFGTADFCMECWIYPIALGTTNCIYNGGAKEGEVWPINELNVASNGIVSWTVNYQNASSHQTLNSITPISLGTWSHIACVRSNNVFMLYIKGKLEASLSWAITMTTPVYASPIVGAARYYASRSYYFNGYIDDFRITKGAARYTANFTPPEQGLGQYIVLFNEEEVTESQLLFDIESDLVSSTVKDVPVMLKLSNSSGLSNFDITPMLTAIKETHTKIWGVNPRNSEFGFQKSSLSDFNTPYITLEKGPTGLDKTAFKFTGNVNSIIDITNSISRSYLLYSLTFSMWIKLDTLQPSTTELLLFGTTGASEFQLTHRSNGELVYRHTSSGFIVGYVRQSKWSHFMMTRDNTAKVIKAYVNGKLIYTYSYTTVPATSANSLYIGGTTSAGSACTLADIKVYDRVLEPDMLQELYTGNDAYFKGISTSIMYQDIPILLGENLTSINVSNTGLVYYSLSQDKRTYYIFDTVWKPIASDNPTIHGFTGDNNPYYWDDASSEWIFSRVPMEETISLAVRYEGNRMTNSQLAAVSNFTGIYNSSVGTIHIAASIEADGETLAYVNEIKINNKQYWISESYTLSDYCDTVAFSAVELKVPVSVETTTDYLSATKVYCKLDNGSSWVECVNGTIPNIPIGFNTAGRSAMFRIVWDMTVWVDPATVSLEVIIK